VINLPHIVHGLFFFLEKKEPKIQVVGNQAHNKLRWIAIMKKTN